MRNLAKVAFVLLFGTITMLFAEVLSGSSILWFVQPSSILITFPFYMIHSIFFLNLAIRLNRTALRGLYVIGIAYGAYEFWFTTVPLYGYINQDPVLGQILGVATFEYFALLFFWHPIFSFILSISVLAYFYEIPPQMRSFPGAHELLKKTPRNTATWLFLLTIGALIISLYAEFNPYVLYIGYGGTLFLVLIFHKLTKVLNPDTDLSDLVVSNNSFVLLGIVIVALYFVGFYHHSTYQIVSWTAFLVIGLTYLLVFILIKTQNNETSVHEVSEIPPEDQERINIPLMLLYPLAIFPIITIFAFVFQPIAVAAFLSLMVFGIGLLLWEIAIRF